jgi:hypothetical protein
MADKLGCDLRLLAGLIVRDLEQRGDIVAATRLDVSGDLVQRQHHVPETAYDNLSPQRLCPRMVRTPTSSSRRN